MYWRLRQYGKPSGGLKLKELQALLPAWLEQAGAAARRQPPGKRLFLFAALHYWIQHSALLGLGLSGLGHQVTLGYLPYANWRKPLTRFDLRRQNAYARYVLAPAAPMLASVSLLEEPAGQAALPAGLQAEIETVSLYDSQYSEQVEAVDPTSPLYRLRLERNTAAARSAYAWLARHRPDAVLIPNGSILEFGAVYRAARSLGLPVVTYEFGEQRERIWFVQNGEVMRQETADLWQACASQPLSEIEWQRVRELFASRQKASLWENFSRRWQNVPSEGGGAVRQALGLDNRPVALLAANVIGDSLTLGRQTFSRDMTEWLQRTIQEFARSPQMQLVVRIHPGERYTRGPSVADVVRRVLPELPGHIHLVAFDAPLNTYDLAQIADLGLVYTTTVGLEMAMGGAPVIVAGQTHYRAKGFTLDPRTWQEYLDLLGRARAAPDSLRPTEAQVRLAWQYAYRFFFDYPLPFPWHLVHMRQDTETWPLARVLSPEGLARFGETFRYLSGEPRRWEAFQGQPAAAFSGETQ
jgi:hypothetical protein